MAKESHYAEALACFDQALKLRPDASEARYQRGMVLKALNKPERAKEDLARFDEQRRQAGRREVAAVVEGGPVSI